MKKEIIINTITGTEIKVLYEYKEEMIDDVVDADGWKITTGRKPFVIDKLTFEFGGKAIKVSGKSIIKELVEDQVVKACESAGVNKYYSGHVEGTYCVFVLDQYNLNKLESFMSEVKKEAADEETREYFKIKKKREKEIEISKAKAVIEKSATTDKNKNGELMTEAEAEEYKKWLDLIYLDGDPGISPHVEIITKEKLQWAHAVLSKYKIKY